MSPACVARRLLSLGLAGALSSCASVSLRELDEMARSTGSQTVVLADEVSLYSPYDPEYSRSLLERIEAQRADVFALFDVQSEDPVFVWLRVDETLGPDLHVRAPDEVSTLGRSQGAAMVVAVAPPRAQRLADGRTVSAVFEVPELESTVRHELVHVATGLLRVRRGPWLTEGIAHAVEWVPIEGGRFRVDPPPRRLLDAASIARERRSVDALLDWTQRDPPTQADLDARLLAFSLVVFAHLEQPASTFRDAFLRVAKLRRADLRALEPAWSAWLDALARG